MVNLIEQYPFVDAVARWRELAAHVIAFVPARPRERAASPARRGSLRGRAVLSSAGVAPVLLDGHHPRVMGSRRWW
jgi:hypothetical protein